jgi:hypothetical protein
MNGVTILNSYEYLINMSNIVVSMFLCMGFIAASIVLFITLLKQGFKDSWIESALLIICVGLAITCGRLAPETKYETLYQVTVDDSVSMNEFQNKYEIIKVEGKIYTVKERVK